MGQPKDVAKTGSPRGIFQEKIQVEEWQEKYEFWYPEISFYIDLSAYIVFPENNFYPSTQIIIGPSGDSYNPPEDKPTNHMFLNTTVNELEKLKIWRLWKYEYGINYGEDTYFLIERESGNTLDCKFKNYNIYEPTYVELELGFRLINKGTFKLKDDFMLVRVMAEIYGGLLEMNLMDPIILIKVFI